MSHVDLHCHSTASDGTFSPADVVRLAKKNKLSGLALTDHDTTNGLAEASARRRNLALILSRGLRYPPCFLIPVGCTCWVMVSIQPVLICAR